MHHLTFRRLWTRVSTPSRRLAAIARAAVFAAALLAGALPARPAAAQCGISIPGRFGGETTAVARVSGGILLVARGTSLEMLNLADNPTAPAPFFPPRRLGLDAPARKISYTIGSPRAFVMLENGDVVAVAVSTAFPSLGSPITIRMSNTVDILADGQLVYIARTREDPFEDDISSDLYIYDVSTGAARFVRSIDPIADTYGFDRLAKIGNVLWTGFHELDSSIFGVAGYDVSNPAAPVRVAASLNNAPLGTRTRVSAMTAIGNKLLLSYRRDSATENEDWLRAVEVSNPAAPVWHPPADLNGFAGCMSSVGDLLRITIRGSGIGTWDTSNPASLAWRGAYFSALPVVGQMASAGSNDYWAAGRAGLMTVHTGNPAAPTVQSTLWAETTGPTDVRQIGNTTVVLDYTLNTLRLYDYTLAESQQLRSSIFLPLYAELLEVGNLAGGTVPLVCVATKVPGAGDSITVYDVTNPAAATVRGTITGFEAHLMSVINSRLYVMTTANELKVYELSQQPPQLRSTTPFGGSSRDYTCLTGWEAGATKAVALGTNPFGLWIINVTDATAPLVSGIYNPVTNYRVRALAKGPNYLYVSALVEGDSPFLTADTRLESISVTNLANPTRRWVSSATAGGGYPGVYDSLAYVATPVGKFLVGTRPDLGDEPVDNTLVISELPGGFPFGEGVPFPIVHHTLPHAGGVGNIARNADGSRVILAGDAAGLYQVAMPVQWQPGFGIQPTDQSACLDGTASFTAFASGNPTNVTYQWYRSFSTTTALTNGPTPWGSTISGANEPTLTISHARPLDRSTYYYCVASNSCGPTSSRFVFIDMCLGDFNCSGSATVEDIFAFLSAWFAGDSRADYDGSGGQPTVVDIFNFLAWWFRGC